MTQQAYYIQSQRTGSSKLGGIVTTITLIGLQDRQQYKVYIDPANFNIKNWDMITAYPRDGFVVTGIRLKDPVKKIVNADSRVSILWQEANRDVIWEDIEKLWQEQDAPKNNFKDLFE